MSRRRNRVRNRRRKRPPNRWLILAQIAMLVGAVAFLYAFGDQIAAGAGNLVAELTDSPGTSSESTDTRDAGSLVPSEPESRAAPALEGPPSEQTDAGDRRPGRSTRRSGGRGDAGAAPPSGSRR